MRKDKRNVIIFLIVVLVIVVISYFIFSNGITNMLKANVQSMSASVNKDANKSDLPVINEVINSSGETLVNNDVTLIINASSKYNIKRVEYSFDLKNWHKIDDGFNNKNISVTLTFSKTMNKNVYIRAINDHGYRSYAYETTVNIDKELPVIEIDKNDDLVIYAKDNVKLSKLQYSFDKLNWDDEELSGEEVYLRKQNFNYNYVRVVDLAGNISKLKEVK